MTSYVLFQNQTAASNGPGPVMSVKPTGIISDNPSSPPSQETVTVTLNGLGAANANVIVVGSNDGANWNQIVTIPVNAASADIAPGQAFATFNHSFVFYGAYLNTISAGDNATCILNA